MKNFKITFRHMSSDPAVSELVEQRLKKLARYFSKPVDAHLVLTQEKSRVVAELNISGDRESFFARETADSALSSVEGAFSRIEVQVHKHRDRRKSAKVHKGDGGVKVFAEEFSGDKEEREIIRTDKFIAKPLTIEEAKLRLEDSEEQFIVFRNAKNERINILYRRRDGNFGLVETE